MKVISVKRNEDYNSYSVSLKFNFIEKIFGYTDKTVELRPTGDSYVFGGQNVYRYRDGSVTPNYCSIAEAIDRFRFGW